MAKYLVVAHQTGDSPMLLERVRELAAADTDAEFVVLTPRRPVTMAMVFAGETRTASQIAVWRAQRTASRLKAIGAAVTSNRLGSYDPLRAIEDELASDDFAGVIISTLSPGLSSWLHMDLPSRVKSHWPALDVIHVITPSAFFRQENVDGLAGLSARPRSGGMP
jgi:hypothetical protein